MHAWDLFLEAATPDAQIARGLGAVLNVSPRSIHVIDRVEASLNVPTGTEALVERSTVRGDARRHLTVYLQDQELIGRTTARSVTVRLLRDLARRLETSLFVSDGELDPSGFLRFRPDGAVEAVTVDDERLDETGIFSVLSEARLGNGDSSIAAPDKRTFQPSAPLGR